MDTVEVTSEVTAGLVIVAEVPVGEEGLPEVEDAPEEDDDPGPGEEVAVAVAELAPPPEAPVPVAVAVLSPNPGRKLGVRVSVPW